MTRVIPKLRDLSVQHLPHSVSIEGVTKRYGSLLALDDVSLSVGAGEFLTLLGPSGSGKTTLLMIIAGFVDPTRGAIRLDGKDITALAPEKRNFGMVFQGYALFPHMTVAENIAFPLKIKKLSKPEIGARVREMLDLVQLSSLGDRLPKQLSGGQQQRVALARALVFSPHLLLLDEPLSALDKKLRAELQRELKQIHQRVGTTFIAVTHDQEEALSMSDRIAVLRDGRIVQHGSPADLYERPSTRFVADFFGTSNFVSGTVRGHRESGFSYALGPHLFEHDEPVAPPPAGSPVLLSIRPDKVTVCTMADATGSCLPGTVRAVTYMGNHFHVLVDAGEWGSFNAVVPNTRLHAVLNPGAAVALRWDPGAAVRVEQD